jgi:5-methylcytosine-specific restriction endonuclease McrA
VTMMNVLLLNASYEPLQVIDALRAVNLLFAGKADLIECVPGREIRSATARHPLPSVLRLRYYVNVPRRGASWSRRGVLLRDHYTCQYCGKRLNGHDATIDHIVPQWKCRRDGIRPHTWGNTVACCPRCQQRKGGRAMHEAGMKFHDRNFEPKMPRTNYLVVSSSRRPEWRQYVRV